jgi:hypothetical protein
MVARWTEAQYRSAETDDSDAFDGGILDDTYVSGLRDLGPDEFDKLVHLFLEGGASQIRDLRVAQRAGDTHTMRRLAHSLKGSASTFGAGSLAARCGELLVRAPGGDVADMARVIDGVDVEYALVSAALRVELVGASRGAGRSI